VYHYLILFKNIKVSQKGKTRGLVYTEQLANVEREILALERLIFDEQLQSQFAGFGGALGIGAVAITCTEELATRLRQCPQIKFVVDDKGF
jgi:hypothetical protein